MGLRCLLGHEYANREVEREREERGDEVVVTYRTVETCDRCGERRIVSENKEVRPVQGPRDETMATGLGSDGVTPDRGEDNAAAEDDTPNVVDAPDEGDPDPTVGESEPEPESEPELEPKPEPAVTDADADADPELDDETGSVDDAIILDADDDDEPSEDRGHGEWPDADGSDREPEPSTSDSTAPDATDGATVVGSGDDWPEPEGEDEGFDAEPSDVDPPAATVGGATTPEDDRGGGATNGTASASSTDKQFVAADEVEPIDDDRDGVATEFFCSNCGYARAAGGSSMRAGDICPECHECYIGER